MPVKYRKRETAYKWKYNFKIILNYIFYNIFKESKHNRVVIVNVILNKEFKIKRIST